MSMNPMITPLLVQPRPQPEEMLRSPLTCAKPVVAGQPEKIAIILDTDATQFLRADAVARAANGTLNKPMIVHSSWRSGATIGCVTGGCAGGAVGISYLPPVFAALVGGVLGFVCIRERLLRETIS